MEWNTMRKTLLAAGIGAIGYAAYRRWSEADLRGQVVAITGGSRGLGLLLAREFAREGCLLAICARDAYELDRAREDLEARGAEVLTVPCDVSDPEEARRFVDETTKRFGCVDVLVNNAGIIQVGPLQSMRVEDFERAMDVMFWGTLHPTTAVLPQMLQRRHGRIVNVTSIGGMVSVPHLLPYNCAKFAAVGLSEGLRAELAREGITVTTIAPGMMRVGSHLNALFRGRQEAEFAWFALGAALPFVSIDAQRAARRIVRAAKRGEAMRLLGLPANLAARLHGLCPGLTANLLGLVNRLLPSADGVAPGAEAAGLEVQERLHSRMLDAATALGRSAALKSHQFVRWQSPAGGA